MFVYIDGKMYPREEAKVSVFDHGLLYGDGVFEGIRMYNGRIFRLPEHIERLYDSAKAIDLHIPLTKDEMTGAILETIRKNNLKNAYIRPIVTRGIGDIGLCPTKCEHPTVIIITTEWGAMYGDLYENGLRAVTVSIRRNPCSTLPPNIKSLNYLNNILAKIEANCKGGDEAIIFDIQGHVSEGSGDNIFVIKNGVIYTPPTLNNLRGITRMVVLEIARSLGIAIVETDLGYFDLYTADEVFVSGTAAEIAPIVYIDGRDIGSGRPGPITRQLMEAFRVATEREGTPVY